MNNKLWVCLCYFIAIIVACNILRGSDVLIETGDWISPNGNYSVQYRQSEDINQGKPRASYIILEKQNVLWVGTSEVDESAHSREIVWSPNSEYALILNRPSRSECEILMAQIYPKTAVVNYKHQLDQVVKEALTATSDTDVHYPEKDWYANWKWRDAKIARGEFHVAKGKQHVILVEIDTSHLADGLKVISVR